jgi:SAM-dependent methyltransferase
MTGAAFDILAARYDAVWSDTAIGRAQREAVWRAADGIFHHGDRILDLGCGTGVDAVHWMSRGVDVQAIDASQEMVRQACGRGVNATRLPIEQLSEVQGPFDGAFSNFGALNCVDDLGVVGMSLSRLIWPGGTLAVCLMSRACAWEMAYYLVRGRVGKAFRRLQPSRASIGVTVHYPSIGELKRAFAPHFKLVRWTGIGLFVPPSYVTISGSAVDRLAAIDRALASIPVLRAMADHRLLVFQRL